jgi:hypothetical protein
MDNCYKKNSEKNIKLFYFQTFTYPKQAKRVEASNLSDFMLA